MLAGYPLGFVWRYLPNNPTTKHIFSTVTGLGLMWFAYDWPGVTHTMITTLITLAMLKFLPRKYSLPVGWVFNVGYLLVGYYFNSRPDGYHVTWTTPQCVLTLRLIGMCFDVSDGGLAEDKMDKDAKIRHLKEVPSVLEMLSFAYHFGGVLVGPQYPFAIYDRFVKGTLMPSPRPSSGLATLKCFVFGVMYLGVSQAFNVFYPMDLIYSVEYMNSRPYLLRLLDVLICARGFMYKYLGVWKLGEAPNILTGLSYNGMDKEGNAVWDGVRNIDLAGYEFATRLQDIITNFNINTNAWMKIYVMKRLRFLGNKELSQLGALLFLALWHGMYFGYFAAFIMEFLDMMIERELSKWTKPYTDPWFAEGATAVQKVLGKIYCVFLWCATAAALAYGAIAYIQLTVERTIPVFNAVYWIGHFPHVLFWAYVILKAVLGPKKKKKEA
uniref:Lysophospholipid acyltransferase 5 n=1 Tax=Eutreptiella gymnastica TaxID=73025 RepID=A0A7S4G606_9EUGL